MAYNNELGGAVVVDLETVAIDGAEQFIEPPTAPGNYKNPDAIARYIEEESAKQVARAALYPWTARIVALGVWYPHDAAPDVTTMRSEFDEACALATFWAHVVEPSGYVSPLITFNGLGFDLPVLIARSRLLGVTAPPLDLSKYRSPHPDLMQILTFGGVLQARGLKWFAKRFGLPVIDETSGADIAALFAAGDMDAIRAHCESDVRLTRALAERVGLLAPVKAVA